MTACFEDLPDELLEHIMSLVSPYCDLDSCKLVSKKWCNAMKRVVHRKQCNLQTALKTNSMRWEYNQCVGISPRHSHAACHYGGTLYAYGGFSTTHTAFNDLIAFDLSKRTWQRLSTSGNYPSPKAGSSLCAYKNKLILYGGCAHPSSSTPFQALKVFDELHTYDVESKLWTVQPVTWPFNMTWHGATVHRNLMVIFGGFNACMGAMVQSNNVVTCLNLDTMAWTSPKCSEPKPPVMFAHSQISLDEDHLIVIGGRDADGLPRGHGAWLLTMGEEPWHWQKLVDENPQWIAPRLWFHPVARVGDCLVAFSNRCDEKPPVQDPPDGEVPAIPQQPEENLNGRRGQFERIINSRNPLPASRAERRKYQLSLLNKYAVKYHKEKPRTNKGQSMNMYVADISDVVETGRVTWQQPRYSVGCPSERVMYRLLLGNSELIMLGGLDPPSAIAANDNLDVIKVNALAFARAPRFLL